MVLVCLGTIIMCISVQHFHEHPMISDSRAECTPRVFPAPPKDTSTCYPENEYSRTLCLHQHLMFV